ATLTVRPSYLITSAADTNGTISPAGTQTVFEGDSVTFFASPNGGFIVHTWFVDDDIVQLGGSTFGITNVNSDRTVTVIFRAASPQADLVVRSYAFANAGEKDELEASAAAAVGDSVIFRIEAT